MPITTTASINEIKIASMILTDLTTLINRVNSIKLLNLLLRDRGPYHIETSPLICRASLWVGFYMISTSVMRELNLIKHQIQQD